MRKAKDKVTAPTTPTNQTTDVLELDEGLILAFARAYVDGGSDALKAAVVVYPGEHNKALKMSALLVKDARVIEAIKNAEDTALTTLPTKAQYAQKLWKMVDDAESDDAKHKFMKLYADARGFIDKPTEPVNQQSVTVVLPRCMEVPSNGSDDDWEETLAKQQEEIMKRAKGRT